VKGIYMKTKMVIFIFVILISGCKKDVSNNLEDSNSMLTKEQIINRANELIISLEFSLDAMKEVYYDVNNKEWKGVLAELNKEDPDFAQQYKIELKNRIYQAVRYRPDITKTVSGELWVFVDKKTGEVITYCGGL